MSRTKEQKTTYHREYARKNRISFSIYGARHRDQLKHDMVLAYGGKCVHCGENDPVVLSLDHIYDDAHVEKERYGLNSRGGHKHYLRLKTAGWPKDRFQLLCFNCNARKEHVRRRAQMQERTKVFVNAKTTLSEAQAKVGKRGNNKSGFKGVFWNTQKQKWHATLMHDYKQKFLGLFDDIRDAAKAHRAGTIELWGDKVPVPTDEEIETIAATMREQVQ